MNRPLTTSEQQTYRGITSSATTGRKYDQLYNITTTTELIKAEFHGRRATPATSLRICICFLQVGVKQLG
jgi:hypothetical protein